jgi:hypothetical protein
MLIKQTTLTQAGIKVIFGRYRVPRHCFWIQPYTTGPALEANMGGGSIGVD